MGIAVLIGTLVFVIGMFYWSDRPSDVVLDDDILTISGPYGIDLPLDKIDSLGISESLPEISKERHGFLQEQLLRASTADLKVIIFY